jgi:predicted RNase H-related nuclease YkuK (DUF458 family)
MQFINPSLGKISLDEIMDDIHQYLQEDPEATYKVVIGTDSQTSKNSTLFVTVLIIHRMGKGTKFYYLKKEESQLKNLHQKIYYETQLSLELMDLLKSHGINAVISEIPIEIHLDIGPKGETKNLISEILGWVSSFGYDVKIKPHSYGASAVADRYTK